MWLEQRLGMMAMMGGALESGEAAPRPANERRVPAVLRQMAVAAAIAAALVVLWAALLRIAG
jgi:hypothetical protein